MAFTKTFRGYKTGSDELEVLAAAQALNVYRSKHEISDDYKVTIVVDGLSRTVAMRMGSEFRKLGIKTRKIVGKKDESSSIIRLADAIAGLTREAQEGRLHYKKLLTKLRAKQTLKEL